jgi:uncharacterized protein involved in exopolysaccharide biosynthesis
VKRQRANDVVSPNPDSQPMPSDDNAREREINTEVALLQSQDLLAQVAKECDLDSSHPHFWSKWIPTWGNQGSKTAEAVRALERHLQVQELPDSNIIQVSYKSHDPQQAAQVLRTLDKLYIAKHVAVYRPPGALNFFQSQSDRYEKELADAESQLSSFDTQQNAPAPNMERDILVKQASQFNGQLSQTHADISSTMRRIHAIENELEKTPARISTQQTLGDNAQLMADLKSTLQSLEIQRTDLLSKYQPTYRPVQDVEKQIAQLKATIAATKKAPLQQNTTDENPTYQLLLSDLAQSEAKLAALRAQASALVPVVHTYNNQAVLLDQKQIKQQDLMRNVKIAEQNYLLYVNKSQQAQISDALDTKRILNVAVAEMAAVPSLPVNSPSVLILAGGILALMISMGSAFTVDYFDPSFRTPDEVIKYLDIPVLAALPKNKDAPRFALPTASILGPAVESCPHDGDQRTNPEEGENLE